MNNFNKENNTNYYMDFDLLEKLYENWKKSKNLQFEKKK